MEYTFNSKHFNIINVLIFDGSIQYESISELKLKDGKLVFEIERRAFENTTRKLVKRKIFKDYILSYYDGKTSILTFNNVLSFNILPENGTFSSNHFIDNIELIDKNHIAFWTCFGTKIVINVLENFTITLKDIKDSDFGKGSLAGEKFYTTEEWIAFLKKEGYQ